MWRRMGGFTIIFIAASYAFLGNCTFLLDMAVVFNIKIIYVLSQTNICYKPEVFMYIVYFLLI